MRLRELSQSLSVLPGELTSSSALPLAVCTPRPYHGRVSAPNSGNSHKSLRSFCIHLASSSPSPFSSATTSSIDLLSILRTFCRPRTFHLSYLMLARSVSKSHKIPVEKVKNLSRHQYGLSFPGFLILLTPGADGFHSLHARAAQADSVKACSLNLGTGISLRAGLGIHSNLSLLKPVTRYRSPAASPHPHTSLYPVSKRGSNPTYVPFCRVLTSFSCEVNLALNVTGGAGKSSSNISLLHPAHRFLSCSPQNQYRAGQRQLNNTL